MCIARVYAFEQDKLDEGVWFYSYEMTEEERSRVENNLQSVVDTIVFFENEGFIFEYGTPISVDSSSDSFLLPLYVDGECKYLVSVTEMGEEYCISFFEDGAKIFDSLENGQYYIITIDDDLYIVDISGKQIKLHDGEEWFLINRNNIEEMSGISRIRIRKTVLPYNDGAKSLIGKTLEVTPIANGGQYGYCWLSSALCITKYFEPSISVSLTTAHNYIHGNSHPLYYCNSGNRSAAKTVIEHYTGMNCTNTTSRCNAANALTSIQSGIPVYMSLSRTDSSGNTIGHACVICGYTLNNTTGVFTYVIMDPNYGSYKYQTSTYSATNVVYSPVSNKIYNWVGALYDWN